MLGLELFLLSKHVLMASSYRKYYIVAVKIINPHKYHVVEVFKKQGDKLLRNLDNKYENLLGQLEFAVGKKLVIKDLDFILNYMPEYEDTTANTTTEFSKTEVQRAVSIVK